MVPVLVGVVIDQAVRTGDVRSLVLWLALLALDFLMLSNAHRIGARLAWVAEERTDQSLRMRVTDRVLDPRGGAERSRLPGALVNIAVGDAKRVARLQLALPFCFAGVAALLAAAIALLRISIPLGLLILLGTPPLLWLLRLLGTPLRRRSGPEQERAAYSSGVAADLVQGVRVLKGLGAEAAAVSRYRLTSREALGATLHAGQAQAWYQGSVLAVNGLFLALIALVGGELAAHGSISVGELVSSVGLAQFLLSPLTIFGRVVSSWSQARPSAERIASVLSSPVAVSGGHRSPIAPVRGELALTDVRHGALDSVTLTVPAGQLLGIVSADPAPVLALLRCLNRESDPDSGSIELDGQPITELDPAALRAAIVVSAHDAEIFAGTLGENVRAAAGGRSELGHPEGAPPDDTRIEPALQAAQADEVARTLPGGLDAYLSEQGRSLSGGQRQRVALARALATDAPVLVLHDPTTALDSVTEARVAGALKALRSGRTTLVATTNPALLAVCDRVVTLDGGAVAASGRHHELVEAHADYRALVLA
jgi:putative ABC transport system ATP-binding protein